MDDNNPFVLPYYEPAINIRCANCRFMLKDHTRDPNSRHHATAYLCPTMHYKPMSRLQNAWYNFWYTGWITPDPNDHDV